MIFFKSNSDCVHLYSHLLVASHLTQTKSQISPIDLNLCLHWMIISDLALTLFPTAAPSPSPPSPLFAPEALSLLFSHILDKPTEESSACCFPYLEFHLLGIQVHFFASIRYLFQCYSVRTFSYALFEIMPLPLLACSTLLPWLIFFHVLIFNYYLF